MTEDDEPDDPLKRFLALVRRETHASDVRLLPAGAEPPQALNVLSARLGRGTEGQDLLVVFAEPPRDREALTRRLQMLVQTFAQSLDTAPPRQPRPPAALSLQEELEALAARARALDAVVIDAHSPVVWGSAVTRRQPDEREDREEREEPEERSDASAVALVDVSRREPGPANEARDDEQPERPSSPEDTVKLAAVSAQAIAAVRAHAAIPLLHKGGRLHAVQRLAALGYVAHSFASIYVLVVVYAEPFDELRAERAVADALPRIERLVLALPPQEPPPAPIAGVVAIRRGRRR